MSAPSQGRRASTLRIGVDLDNTIVCYDELFRQLAVARDLAPADAPPSKRWIRDHLRSTGREDTWTEMQGEAYGPMMREAASFPGVAEFFAGCAETETTVYIVSHRTRHPYRGAQHDLHEAAIGWLREQGFVPEGEAGPAHQVYLELTREAKLQRIAELECTHFIDDLPEFLTAPGFPQQTRRVLFDPRDEHPDDPQFARATSWQDIARLLLSPRPYSAMNQHELQSTAARLAAGAGYTVTAPPEPIAPGRNNRVFLLRTRTRPLLLKHYFHEPGGRDRLASEFGFASFAWDHGVRAVPEPIAADEALHLGLFAYLEGRPLQPAEVTAARVDEALDFFAALNRHREAADARSLPNAAEACFSPDEHLATVDRRVAQLAHLADRPSAAEPDEIEREFHEFVTGRLAPAWNDVRAAAAGGVDQPVPQAQRCLSPSDFGFHNALLTDDERLVFFDFEYAGWDDPAKLVCDFFCQVQLPAPEECWDAFTAGVIAALGLPPANRERCARLLPVYRVKWCCIILNEFLRPGDERRRFARGDEDVSAVLMTQLEKARRYLARIQTGEALDGPG